MLVSRLPTNPAPGGPGPLEKRDGKADKCLPITVQLVLLQEQVKYLLQI